MKYFYTLALLVFLASCTAAEKPMDDTVEVSTATETTTSEIDNELSEIEEVEMEENKMVKLDAKYTNPETDVDMTIEYSLDSEGKIETINVSATTYDISGFNTAAQVVIGKTIAEAKETSIAGGSLTNAAFKNALK